MSDKELLQMAAKAAGYHYKPKNACISDKQTASGHKDEKMLDIYDMELPEVPTSEKR